MSNRLQDLRLVDPVLTGIMAGYANNTFVADEIFPVVEVDKEAGKVPVLTREHWKAWETERAVGADSNIGRFRFLEAPKVFGLTEYDFAVPVDYRESSESDVLALDQYTANNIAHILMNAREARVASMVQTAGNYTFGNTSSPSTKWDLTNSTPLKDIIAAMEVIRRNTGMEPNTIVFSAIVWNVLRIHPDFVDRFKFANTPIITPEMVANAINPTKPPKIVIGSALSLNDNETTVSDLWLDNTILAVVTPGIRGQRSVNVPSFGYTLQKRNWPQADTYPSTDKKKTFIRGTFLETQLMHGNNAGYLLSNVLST